MVRRSQKEVCLKSPLARALLEATSQQPENDLNIDLHSYRHPIFHPRRKLPSPYRLDGLFIQAHAQRLLHSDLARPPIGTDHHPEHDRTLVLRLPGFVGVLGIRVVNWSRRRYPSAHAVRSFTAPNSAAMAGADSATRTAPVGRRSENRRQRIADLRSLWLGEFRRPDKSHVLRQLGLLPRHNDGRRSELLASDARQASLGFRLLLPRSTATVPSVGCARHRNCVRNEYGVDLRREFRSVDQPQPRGGNPQQQRSVERHRNAEAFAA